MWQGIQHITNYRGNQDPPTVNKTSLAEELNCFFARFETKGLDNVATTPPDITNHVLILQTQEVRQILSTVNAKKAAGPDEILGRVLRDCAHQLAEVFTDIFNLSLSQAIVPACLKSAIIIPVPKQTNISCLNDYRLVALIPIIAKCFERLVLKHIIPLPLDQHQ